MVVLVVYGMVYLPCREVKWWWESRPACKAGELCMTQLPMERKPQTQGIQGARNRGRIPPGAVQVARGQRAPQGRLRTITPAAGRWWVTARY
jgi:hypothetical protein